MKVVAAYLLTLLGGNTSPSAEDLKSILGSVGADADEDRIALLLSEVKGKDITELIASGREKLASVPSGGGGGVAVAASAGGAAPAAAAAETKKEEKVEEKEESDDDMGFTPASNLAFDVVSLVALALVGLGGPRIIAGQATVVPKTVCCCCIATAQAHHHHAPFHNELSPTARHSKAESKKEISITKPNLDLKESNFAQRVY
ncbi:60S acidic ribosomal protein P2B-like protein [Tanacetum coccineum]